MNTTYISAVVILAPHQVQAFAMPLMRQHSYKSTLRVPAHITVLFPVRAAGRSRCRCRKLRDLCRGYCQPST